jgi:GNAT superfamily N-acetyltransferase
MKKKESSKKVTIRKWKKSDIPGLVDCYRSVYGKIYKSLASDDKRLFEFNIQNFSEGQCLAEIDGQIVGYACSILVQLDETHDSYSYAEITGDGSFSTHNPSGDTLYGADIAVLDSFRGQGIAKLFYKERKKILKRYNLRRMVAHGRIPGYSEWAGKHSPEEYVEEVKEGRIKDPALNAHLSAGYQVKRILLEKSQDTQSLNYATWLQFENPDYNAIKRKIAASPVTRPVRRVRVCAAQFEMRAVADWAGFENNAKFFIDSASSYHSHLLVYPELITAQLFSLFDPDMPEVEAVEKLTEFTDRYINFSLDRIVVGIFKLQPGGIVEALGVLGFFEQYAFDLITG